MTTFDVEAFVQEAERVSHVLDRTYAGRSRSEAELRPDIERICREGFEQFTRNFDALYAALNP